jgi:hypothetical protein
MTLIDKLPTASRIVLGLIFTVFGLNGFLGFIPQPPAPAAAGAFAGALAASGYIFPVLKGIEIVAGVLLLARVAVPFALTVLAPIVLNIVLYHLFLAPGGLAIAIVVLTTELYLAWTYRTSFAPLFAKTKPRESSARGRAGGHAVA